MFADNTFKILQGILVDWYLLNMYMEVNIYDYDWNKVYLVFLKPQILNLDQN